MIKFGISLLLLNGLSITCVLASAWLASQDRLMAWPFFLILAWQAGHRVKPGVEGGAA